jgi:hypothetical protein
MKELDFDFLKGNARLQIRQKLYNQDDTLPGAVLSLGEIVPLVFEKWEENERIHH